MQNPNAPAPVPSVSLEEPFLHKVGKPLVWLAAGYLLATLIQRPTRTPKNA